MNESSNRKTREWVETGTLLVVLLMAVAGSMRGRVPTASPYRTLTTLAPWVGVGITLIAFLLNATWQAAKVDSAIAGQAAAIAAQGVRIDQSMAQRAAEEQREQELERKVLFLCNERRRDNDEAGRTANGAPC